MAFVIQLGHLDSLAKQPLPSMRSVSRASSLEPQICSSKACCCRCKGCLCNQTATNVPITATINPNRKTSMPITQPSQNVPYYYGSLGRKSRESRVYLSQLQAMKSDPVNDIIYAQPRQPAPRMATTNNATLKPGTKFTNLSMDNYKSPYATVRRESTGYNYANLDRVNNSTMI